MYGVTSLLLGNVTEQAGPSRLTIFDGVFLLAGKCLEYKSKGIQVKLHFLVGVPKERGP